MVLAKILEGIGDLRDRVTSTEAQNEHMIRDHADAEQSRSRIHARLDEMSVNVAGVQVDVGTQGKRLDALDPIIAMLKDANLERKTVRRVIKNFCKNGYVLGGAGLTAAAGAWHQWEVLREALLKLLGAKVGGP